MLRTAHVAAPKALRVFAALHALPFRRKTVKTRRLNPLKGERVSIS
jgi:hypothetical protein